MNKVSFRIAKEEANIMGYAADGHHNHADAPPPPAKPPEGKREDSPHQRENQKKISR
jgi:hypothetical protein